METHDNKLKYTSVLYVLYTKALTRSLFLSKTLFKGFKNELQKFDGRCRSPIQICRIFQKIQVRKPEQH